MKTYYAIDLSETDGPMRARVYAAYDADQRIEKLERALKSASLLIVKQRAASESLATTSALVLSEIDEALSL